MEFDPATVRSGFSRKDVLELYRLVDWLVGLPPELERDFKRQVRDYEESKVMPYVTSIERMAKEEGRSEGWTQGLEKGLEKGREEGPGRDRTAPFAASLGVLARRGGGANSRFIVGATGQSG